MSTNDEQAADVEPPSTIGSERASLALAERVMAIGHVSPAIPVAVIGHHTLALVLALMRRGCGSVRSLRPGAPAPDCEPAGLVWIVDAANERELDDALRAARWRAG